MYVGNDPVNFLDPSGLTTIGFSAYAIFGGGAKLSVTDKGWSVCVEIGLGKGGGLEVDPNPFGGLEKSGDKIKASIDLSYGPAGAGYEVSIDECGKPNHGPKFKLGPLEAKRGELTLNGNPGEALLDTLLPEGGYKVVAVAKVAAQSCRGGTW